MLFVALRRYGFPCFRATTRRSQVQGCEIVFGERRPQLKMLPILRFRRRAAGDSVSDASLRGSTGTESQERK